MTWTPEIPSLETARERAEKALSLPIGLASPLWIAFGAAASAGVAWWWMTRWGRAVNLESMLALPKAVVFDAAPAAVNDVVAAPVAQTPDPEADSAPDTEAKAHPKSSIEAAADDLTRLVGVGPRLAAALAERGVTRFEQIAAWTTSDVAKVDAELKLLGRATRDAWVAQARRFASEALSPPASRLAIVRKAR